MLRPTLPNALVTDQSSEVERFQNEVIRPIIKGLHALLISHFQIYLSNKKIDFKHLVLERQQAQIEAIFTKDSAFRQEVKGMVMGHLIIEEFQLYTKHASELNKRIIQIIQQRMLDSIMELT